MNLARRALDWLFDELPRFVGVFVLFVGCLLVGISVIGLTVLAARDLLQPMSEQTYHKSLVIILAFVAGSLIVRRRGR